MGSRRSVRDWLVDIGLFLFASVFWLVLVSVRLDSDQVPEQDFLFMVDLMAGLAGCGVIWLRRRWPVGVAIGLLLAGGVSELVGGAAMVALFTVTVRRSPRVTAALFVLGMATSTVYLFIRPEGNEPILFSVFLGLAVQSAVVGWGVAVRHRAELVESLRERAARAEAEADLRAERAQLQAREAIAREMHDVLGHRLSLLSVHAGALEYHPDAPAEDVARAASVIRESAHQALQDLREVIGVLRAPVQELPQPTYEDLPVLVAESVAAGMAVTLTSSVPDLPDGVGRTIYRMAQECLTNARKHAAGSTVDVTVTGSPVEGVTLTVVNTRGAADFGGPGHGLLGLAERAALAGGTLTHGPAPDGGWRVAAWLPWPT